MSEPTIKAAKPSIQGSAKPKGIFILVPEVYDKVYGKEMFERIAQITDIREEVYGPDTILKNISVLKDIEVIFSSWGMAKMDKAFLDAAPALKAVFYAAGSIRYFITDEFWARNKIISSAYAANAVPVAEFALSQILSCLKRQFFYNNKIKRKRTFASTQADVPGAYGSSVGIISLGEISKRVIELLRPFNINIFLSSNFLSHKQADEMGVKLASIEEIFETCDVISLHSPINDKTKGMIKGEHFKRMKQGASFINTARGAVVRELEMIEVLKQRPDITAMLDVTEPEPPVKDSELYDLENVFMTPHIAGSVGRECRRMGQYMLDEYKRYLSGQPLLWQITREKAAFLA